MNPPIYLTIMRGLFLTSLVLTSEVSATVILNGTRVIIDGNKNEAAITLSNPDKTTYLVQSWVEEKNGERHKTPFLVTPPLSRIDPEQINTLRIVLIDPSLPDNKESLFWLNVKAIPSIPTKAIKESNDIVFIVKNVIKLIYRPASLQTEKKDKSHEKLEWSHVNNFVEVKNPTPFVISFGKISIDGKEVVDVNYILPFTSSLIKKIDDKKPINVSFSVVNDYGGESVTYTKKIM